MANIYDQHSKAFENVSAYVILKDCEKVATIAIKYPRDGAGRLNVYVHWLGFEMVKGHAGGYGYDKASAALSNAATKMIKDAVDWDHEQFVKALATDAGSTWDSELRKAGFTVLQAV